MDIIDTIADIIVDISKVFELLQSKLIVSIIDASNSPNKIDEITIIIIKMFFIIIFLNSFYIIKNQTYY